MGTTIALLLLGLIRLYQLLISPILPPTCRFEPSCSRYAQGALRRHRLSQALRLVIARIARCRPGGGEGYDPVPDRN